MASFCASSLEGRSRDFAMTNSEHYDKRRIYHSASGRVQLFEALRDRLVDMQQAYATSFNLLVSGRWRRCGRRRSRARGVLVRRLPFYGRGLRRRGR